ncbi:MAG: NAD-dependent epimerase/dehydratase family protein [Pseudomonas sp.]|uniref:NAD-dependent epimerase/dehydratase family protein n=1 Tax=Pseudomonas sp. TaxID=306 RepID=UPI00339AADFE
MTVVVVGRNSFIARSLRQRKETAGWSFVRTSEALGSDQWLTGASALINCAYDPQLKSSPYNPALDVDMHLAQRVLEMPGVRYLMLSSRQVYGPAPFSGRLQERTRARPATLYGQAKLMTEQRLSALLGPRLTVLRLSNICGFEIQEGRQSFFALAQRGLLERGRVTLDMSPFVERDFLPVEVLAGWLPGIVRRLRPGLFNIGAGQGTPTGRIAQWLIEGFGGGELVVSQLREHDPFWLDIGAATQAFAIAGCGQAQLRDYCRALGRRLGEARGAFPCIV